MILELLVYGVIALLIVTKLLDALSTLLRSGTWTPRPTPSRAG